MAADDPKPLDDLERVEHARLLMADALARTKAMARPVAILTGGQPGSGKSYIVRSVGVEFENLGGIVKIDPDEVRPTLPYMAPRIAAGDLDIPDAAYSDAGTVAYKMIQIAKAERRNVVIDGTLQNTGRALSLADELGKAGYEVQFRGMAVHPDLSHARTYTRREEQIASSPTGFGRGVGDDFHDAAVSGYRDTIEAFQQRSAVSSMTFYAEGGKMVETKLVNGQWTPAVSMKDELARAQAQPDIKAMMAASDSWWEASHLMKRRGADDGEVRRIDAFKQFSTLQERQMRPTSIKASITMPPLPTTSPNITAPALAPATKAASATPVAPIPIPAAQPIDPDLRSLSEPAMLAVAKIVHEGIRNAGRDADDSMMSVTWTPDETYLDIRTPTPSGRFERFRLPGHENVEKAFDRLRKGGVTGMLDVDYSEAKADPVRNVTGDVSLLTRSLGISPADIGVREDGTTPGHDAQRTTPAMQPGVAAALSRARSRQGI